MENPPLPDPLIDELLANLTEDGLEPSDVTLYLSTLDETLN